MASAHSPRHPASAERFDWDDWEAERGNVAKLAARAITPEDVEHVWQHEPQYRRNKNSATASWLMTGRDLSGRTLTIGILWKDPQEGTLRAITGWPE